ncbi:MAG: riboflavin synthase [Pseudobdellovibrio sp.]
MFSGIVETTAKLIKSETLNQAERIWIEKPHAFDDLSVGDSICTNGVCLTVEAFDEKQIQFCLGAETLSLLKQSLPYWKDKPLNLERSLKFGDRVHGHLVTGHVDQSAQIVVSEPHGDVWDLAVEASDEQARYFWKKGSACVNGVSLTINKVAQNKIYFCLIPETLKITNLQYYKVGDFVNLESDYLAKAYIHSRQEKDL